jgi:putative membrane-bound dehydrogenase-like protein
MRRLRVPLPATAFASAALPFLLHPLPAQTPATPQPTHQAATARRLQVLFLGAPTQNGPHHDPITRYAALKRGLGTAGIDLTYSEDPAQAFTHTTLQAFDAVLLYGDWQQQGTLPEPQLRNLLDYVERGGGFVPVHCASACWGRSPQFVRLVGGRFQNHGGEEFEVANLQPDHPALRGVPGFRAWDETYVHDSHGEDRTVLQVRAGEPWTWVRSQGQGRVFYTAAGHDHRVWDRPEYQQLLRQGLVWAAGEKAAQALAALELPVLETEAVTLPGYRERRAIVQAQKPLPAEASRKLIQVPVGFDVTLFASEPEIVNPIAIAWDARGRAYVVETVDYPNNLQRGDLGHDRITLCEDRDGDGRADRFVRFAEGLSIPTSVVCVDGGVLCTNGPEVLYLADTDGDDRADVRRVLFSGFSMGDTHAGVSNLRLGLDGWIWATIGYSGFRGNVGGTQHEFAQGVLRFRSDGSALEFVQHTTNNTWGLGFTAAGDVVGSTANGNPSWYATFAERAYRAVGLEAPTTPRADRDPKFFPISTDIRQVDFFDRFTAAAGHAIATGGRLPAAWQDRVAFVCEPTGKLVAQFDLERRGAGFAAEQSPNNLFASADAWTSPVCAEIGPDGAVWICDWYNLIVQHNPTPTRGSAGVDARTGRGNAYETPLRDTQHGRIWRVFPRGSKNDAVPPLGAVSERVAALDHAHQAWRLHAQWLLTGDRAALARDAAALAALRRAAAAAGRAAPHALEVLASVDGLDAELLRTCFASGDLGTARAALRHAGVDLVKQVFVRGGRIAAEGRLLAEVLVALSGSAADAEIGAAVFAAGQPEAVVFGERALRDAWTIAARRHAGTVLAAAAAAGALQKEPEAPRNLLPNATFEQVEGDAPMGWRDLRVYGGARAPNVQVAHDAAGHRGPGALRIQSDRPSDCGVATVVPVQKATRYRLSGWIRTADVKPQRGSDGAMLNVHGGARTRGVQGTSDWTQVAVEFDSGDQTELVVHCLFGGYGGATGTAWFDDVALEPLGSGATLQGALQALAAYHGAPVAAPTAPTQRQFAIDAAAHERGAAVYNRTCIACHGLDGKGLAPVFPPLDGSTWLTGSETRPIDIVLHGLQGPIQVGETRFDSLMAPLGTTLSDGEIADALTYARQRWSNDAAPITAAQVAARRALHRERTRPWTAAELDR